MGVPTQHSTTLPRELVSSVDSIRPTRTMAPTTACDVETGRARKLMRVTVMAAERPTANARLGLLLLSSSWA